MIPAFLGYFPMFFNDLSLIFDDVEDQMVLKIVFGIR